MRGRNPEPKDLRKGPLMVGKASRHGGSTMNPSFFCFGNPDGQAQAVMKVMKVVKAANNEHAGLKDIDVVSQGIRCRKVALMRSM